MNQQDETTGIYEIWKKTETHTNGCPEDESESSTTKTHFYIIKESELEDFKESMADDYGYQDYNYQIGYSKLMNLDSKEELKKLSKTIIQALAMEKDEENEN